MKKQILIGAMALLTLGACSTKHLPCGQPVPETYRPVVYFDWDSAVLTPQAISILNEMSEHTGKCPRHKMRVTGYADNTGNPNYNVKLAQDRALAVQNYLLSIGYKPEQIQIVSDGDRDPVASNETAAGRAENRRAVVKFY